MKEFIDEYKHLEKLCSEIYGQQHGISQYIADMEQTSSYTAGRIQGWSSDLANLKRVRHIRNKIVHDAEEYDDAYEPEDLAFIKQFYQRILTQQDPLASRKNLTKKNDQKRQKSTANNVTGIPGYYVSPAYSVKPIEKNVDVCDNNRKRKQKGIRLEIIVVPCAIMLIIVLLSLLYMYGK